MRGWVPSILAVPTIPVTQSLHTGGSGGDPWRRAQIQRRHSPITGDWTIFPSASSMIRQPPIRSSIGATGGLGAGRPDVGHLRIREKTAATEIFRHAVLLSRVNNLPAAPDGGKSICAGGFNHLVSLPARTCAKRASIYVSVDTHAVTVGRPGRD